MKFEVMALVAAMAASGCAQDGQPGQGACASMRLYNKATGKESVADVAGYPRFTQKIVSVLPMGSLLLGGTIEAPCEGLTLSKAPLTVSSQGEVSPAEKLSFEVRVGGTANGTLSGLGGSPVGTYSHTMMWSTALHIPSGGSAEYALVCTQCAAFQGLSILSCLGGGDWVEWQVDGESTTLAATAPDNICFRQSF